MLRQLGLKLLQTVLVVLAVSLVVFIMNYFGGDPVYMMLPPQSTAADIAAMRRSMGLDQPVLVQYGLYMLNLARGQLGSSWTQARPVLGLILERLPATLEVAGCGMLLALLIGIPSGLIAATAPRSWFAKTTGIVSILGISIPPFWLGISLILTFAVDLGWFPSSGRGATVSLLGIPVSVLTLDGLKHLALPSLTSALFNTCLTMRLQYAATREELTADYVRYAVARGVPRRRIVAVHAFPNTLIPMITFSAMVFAQSIAFSVVIETIFAWPGVGKLLIDAIGLNDRPLIMGYLIFIAVLFSLINLSADLTYGMIDPRVRLGAPPRSR